MRHQQMHKRKTHVIWTRKRQPWMPHAAVRSSRKRKHCGKNWSVKIKRGTNNVPHFFILAHVIYRCVLFNPCWESWLINKNCRLVVGADNSLKLSVRIQYIRHPQPLKTKTTGNNFKWLEFKNNWTNCVLYSFISAPSNHIGLDLSLDFFIMRVQWILKSSVRNTLTRHTL